MSVFGSLKRWLLRTRPLIRLESFQRMTAPRLRFLLLFARLRETGEHRLEDAHRFHPGGESVFRIIVSEGRQRALDQLLLVSASQQVGKIEMAKEYWGEFLRHLAMMTVEVCCQRVFFHPSRRACAFWTLMILQQMSLSPRGRVETVASDVSAILEDVSPSPDDVTPVLDRLVERLVAAYPLPAVR